MKIIVTGGAGFIGSHLVDKLVEESHQVFVIDKKKKKDLRFGNPCAKYFELEIGDERVREVFEEVQPDAVCHLAAQISVVSSVENPVEDARTNILDALQILVLAEKYKCSRFVFTSSGGAICGESKKGAVSEIENAKPISPYGIAKLAFENYLTASPLSGVAVRFSNVYGPRQMPDGEAGVISIFLEKIFGGKTALIFGNGKATRDYVYVLDAVLAIEKALNSDFNGVLNISTGVETSVLALWEELSKIHGEDTKVEFRDARPGEIQRSCLDFRLAEKKINWSASTDLKKGLQLTYKWFKDYK